MNSSSRHLVIGLALGIVIAAACAMFDRAAFHLLYVGAGLDSDAATVARDALAKRDWYQALRAVGFLPMWIALGLALLLIQTKPGEPRRDRCFGLRVMGAAALAGGIAEGLRPLIERVRPLFTDGVTRFHSVPGLAREQISFGGASSHAAVAFGGAFAILLAHPRAGWIVLPLAAGCAYTRLASGAHFLSDIAAGAWLGFVAAAVLSVCCKERA
jgi:undecaprenyl-diphosphatase